MVKKLKYFLFFLPLLFIDNVYANTYQLTFSSLVGAGTSYSIVSNNNQSIAYDVPFSGNTTNYEWTTTNSPTCSSTAVVSGIIYLDNTNFGINNDDVGWGRVYIRPNSSSGATNCSIQVADNGTRYVCTASSLSSNFIIGYTLNSNTPQTTLNHVITRNVDINCDTSTGQIIENQNINTQNIINNNTQNTQDIINNQNANTNQIIQDNQQNTQDIINNQNQNTEDIINSQNETFGNFCYTNLFPTKEFTSTSSSRIVGTGSIINGIPSQANKTYTISFDITQVPNSDFRISLINSSNVSVSQSGNDITNKINSVVKEIRSIGSYSISLTTTQNGYLYLRSVPVGFKFDNIQLLESSQVFPFVPYNEKKCINKLDEQTNAINGLNDTLNDISQPNTNEDIEDMNDMVASDTPISDLITMPLTLINAYINGVNSSCSPVNLGNLYGTDLILPCINLQQRLGTNLWNTIDIFFSIFMCYNIGMLFITAFDGLTSLRDDFEGLYQPRHADTGYRPKHGG